MKNPTCICCGGHTEKITEAELYWPVTSGSIIYVCINCKAWLDEETVLEGLNPVYR